MMIIEEIKDPAARRVAGLSTLYARLAHAFRYPDASLFREMASPEFEDALRTALRLAGLNERIKVELGFGSISSLDVLEQRYLELFEIGGEAGSPCVIYEGEFGGGRLKVMEDVLRFFDHFGLQPSDDEGNRDRPDNLATELEFMHFLTYQEVRALDTGDDPAPFRAGQRDFLRFHLGDFLDAVADKAAPRGVVPYSALAQMSRAVCHQHIALLHSEPNGGTP